MRFIEHIIEPTKLLLAWQSSDETHRVRYVVAELNRDADDVSLIYLINTDDFKKAQARGFDSYPAFKETDVAHNNVMDAFMRRVPPRSRGDFHQYLEGLRLRPDACLSNFALLGYSGAKLPSDGFSLIHPFNDVDNACELVIEAAGFRHKQKKHGVEAKIDTPVSFSKEFNEAMQETAIRIVADGVPIGYVTRGLIPTFLNWMTSGRIANAWVEKTNGMPGKPTAYIFVEVSGQKR